MAVMCSVSQPGRPAGLSAHDIGRHRCYDHNIIGAEPGKPAGEVVIGLGESLSIAWESSFNGW